MSILKMIEKKKKTLDNLYYNIGKQQFDFFVAGTFKQKDGVIGFSKWKKYSEAVFPIDFDGSCREDWKTQKFFEQINQRQILPIEVVLDIEDKNQIKPIVEKLEKWKWDYEIWDTGSRGYHIHIISKEEFNQEEKEAFIRNLGTDMQKCSDKCLIALENCPHWKTGNLKRMISKEDILK